MLWNLRKKARAIHSTSEEIKRVVRFYLRMGTVRLRDPSLEPSARGIAEARTFLLRMRQILSSLDDKYWATVFVEYLDRNYGWATRAAQEADGAT